MTDFEITDDLLKQLVQEWGETLPYRYPLKMETPPELSKQFLDKMELLFIKAEKMEKQAKYIALRTAATILAAALATTVAMAYAVRYFKMVREKHEKYSAIYYEQVEDGFSSDEFICCHITYIPEGFSQIQSRKSTFSYREKYRSGNGLVIVLNQTKIDQANFSVDTENTEPINIKLDDNISAQFIENETYNAIFWDDGVYSFCISGNLRKEVLVKIAKSVSFE